MADVELVLTNIKIIHPPGLDDIPGPDIDALPSFRVPNIDGYPKFQTVLYIFTLEAKCAHKFGVQEHDTLVFKIPIPDPIGFDDGLIQAREAVAAFGNALATVALTP
jgi:hypothetical protein